MTTEPPTPADVPRQWLAISGSQPEPADLRLYERMSAEDTEQNTKTGDAWFVGITRAFTGCADPRADLERVATAWFEQSGLAPMLAQVDADAQAVTFWKAAEVKDAAEAIRLTHDGITRAMTHIDLAGGVLRPGFTVDVIAERDIDDRY
jgi:hypothetical protein